MSYIDTYVKAGTRDELDALCAGFVNVLGPAQGRVVQPEAVSEDGVIPAQAAAGDPAKWYACVRYKIEQADELKVLPKGVTLCDQKENEAVLGVWS